MTSVACAAQRAAAAAGRAGVGLAGRACDGRRRRRAPASARRAPRGCARTASARRGWSRARAARRGRRRPRARRARSPPPPTPANGQPSCTTTQRCVSRTDASIAALVERAERAQVDDLDLDALLPPASSAASSAACTIFPQVTIVHVAPGRFTSATPSGTTCSPVGHLALQRVERLALDEAHRVVVADGGLEQALARRPASPA